MLRKMAGIKLFASGNEVKSYKYFYSLLDYQAERICVSVPLYHCFGLVAGVLSGALFGATCVLPAEAFSGSACVEAILSEKYVPDFTYVAILATSQNKD